MQGAAVLIALGFFLNALPLINYSIKNATDFLQIFTIWSWVVLFIKRLHDGGRSGWYTILIMLVLTVLAIDDRADVDSFLALRFALLLF
jgi:uncharacterized membrane protein YhaH (DUF805 family)